METFRATNSMKITVMTLLKNVSYDLQYLLISYIKKQFSLSVLFIVRIKPSNAFNGHISSDLLIVNLSPRRRNLRIA